MNTTTFFINTNSGNQDFAKILGEYLENELSESGFTVSLPSFTDWGYAFRTKYGKHEFDVVIQRSDICNNTFTIAIVSTLNWFHRLLSVDDVDECKALSNTVENMLKSDSFKIHTHSLFA